eukprot:SAG11_NODE_7579_length_1126_cov_1.177215_1_plen_40_part_10
MRRVCCSWNDKHAIVTVDGVEHWRSQALHGESTGPSLPPS